MKAKSGFTLVEILIVVVILGILAAIVIPQFTEASTEAKLSSLCTDLQTLRSQIELYKVQHLERYPDVDENGKPDTANFVARLTESTDNTGKLDPNGAFGPYLRNFPTNPFVRKKADEVSFGDAEVPGDRKTGWYFNTQTGEFHANDPEHKDL